MEDAIIRGCYADIKTIKTRSTVQMVIELPVEQGAEIIRKFGFPNPGVEVPVVVALLNENKENP